jgi:hypothetical protein
MGKTRVRKPVPILMDFFKIGGRIPVPVPSGDVILLTRHCRRSSGVWIRPDLGDAILKIPIRPRVPPPIRGDAWERDTK